MSPPDPPMPIIMVGLTGACWSGLASALPRMMIWSIMIFSLGFFAGNHPHNGVKEPESSHDCNDDPRFKSRTYIEEGEGRCQCQHNQQTHGPGKMLCSRDGPTALEEQAIK